jgi:murein L,D-transpeptidase YafK
MPRLVSALVLFLLVGVCDAGEKADRVLVVKSAKLLRLFKGENLIGSYGVVFGGDPIGHKQREGDGRTPEGNYVLDYKKKDSDFYRAIHISYPNAADVKRAQALGVSPGGAIMIHGQRNGYGWASFIMQRFNWTDGCIALSNADMAAVWAAVDAGTPIEIKP